MHCIAKKVFIRVQVVVILMAMNVLAMVLVHVLKKKKQGFLTVKVGYSITPTSVACRTWVLKPDNYGIFVATIGLKTFVACIFLSQRSEENEIIEEYVHHAGFD